MTPIERYLETAGKATEWFKANKERQRKRAQQQKASRKRNRGK